MKYVILIHSHPQPWGHPTCDYLPEYQALPQADKDRSQAEFEELLSELSRNGELVTAEALGHPDSSRIYRWDAGAPLVSDGPYSETKEHLAGFFLIDVESEARADEIAGKFASPGDIIELRPAMWPGGDEA